MRLAWTNCPKSVSAGPNSRQGGRVPVSPISPQMLFDAIDGNTLRVLDREWEIEVFSVLLEAGATWVQLALTGRPSHTLILRLPPQAGVTHVTCLLSSWLVRPTDIPQVLNVA